MDLGSDEYVRTLQLMSPNFQEGNKWRFSDGSASFFAKISDKKFLDAINERRCLFGKVDILKVKIWETKRLEATRSMSSEKEIVHVLELRPPNVQLPLPGLAGQEAEEALLVKKSLVQGMPFWEGETKRLPASSWIQQARDNRGLDEHRPAPFGDNAEMPATQKR